MQPSVDAASQTINSVSERRFVGTGLFFLCDAAIRLVLRTLSESDRPMVLYGCR